MNRTQLAGVFQAAWDSPRWRWWSLAGGILLVILGFLIGLLLGLITGEEARPLVALVLFVAVIGLSLIGSGMLEGLNRRMTGEDTLPEQRRKLRREQAEDDEDDPQKAEQAALLRQAQERQDRRTIAAGIALIPVLAAFLYALFTL